MARVQCRLQSAKTGVQMFDKMAVQSYAEPRSSGWSATENLVLILVLVWCLFGVYTGRTCFC